jgi:spermidine/putrescine-binding protein
MAVTGSAKHQGVIRFLNWVEYTSPAIIKRFEVETGIHVDEITFDSEEESLSRLAGGEEFDVVMATDYYAARYYRAGLVQPLDMARLPNWRHVTSERLRGRLHDYETDDRRYTSANYFGSEGFAVRFDKVDTVKTSWEMLYEPSLAGGIDMIDGAREVLGPALFCLGSGPNSTDPQLVEKAAAMAVDQRPLVRSYDSDYPARRIVEGVPVVHCWDGDVARAIVSGVRQVRYILPQEGFALWVDGPCIPRAARNVDAAYAFLNYLLEPEIMAENATFSGYQPVVEAAAAIMNSPVHRSLRPSDLEIENGTFLADLLDFEAVYEAAYRRVKSAPVA